MKNIPYVKTWESEIDLLIVEELFSSINFRKWLQSKLFLIWDFEFLWAWKSYNWYFWECDIVFNIKNEKENILILIENKIYAPEQFEQAIRYHKNWENIVNDKDNNITRYITCLISPEIYFQEDAPMKEYEYKISYESILSYFEKQEKNPRIEFKIMVINNWIERARTWYQRITDSNTDNFYNYFENVSKKYPILEYKRPKEVAKSNSWIIFSPKILPPKVKIVYKWDRWFLDLQIWWIKQDYFFDENYNFILKNKLSLHKTWKSISVRKNILKLPVISNIENIENYKEDINIIIENAFNLLNWYLKNKELLKI